MAGKRLSLNQKLIIGTVAGILVSVVVFVVIFSFLYKKQLYSERENAASQINQLFHALLKKTMLNNQKDELNHLIGNLVQQNPDLSSIFILSNSGKIVFSNVERNIGTRPDLNLQDTSSLFNIIVKEDKEVLRKITTVYTEPECTVCHKSIAEQPVRGYIMVDYDVSTIKDKTFWSLLMLTGSGAFITFINIIGGLWFIRRFVLHPVEKISQASKELAAGDLKARVDIRSNDEFSDLATTFNFMGQSLEKKISQLNENKDFLQNLVDTFPDGICIINKDFDITLSNKAYRQRHDISSKHNKCYIANFQRDKPCIPTMISCPVAEIIEENKQGFKTVQQHIDKTGNHYYVEVNAMPMEVKVDGVEETFIIESIRDYADEVKYSHETRLAEFGMLAYGVAHEILNPLSTIKFALHSCVNNKHNDQIEVNDLLENIKIIEDEIGACIDVTDRLLKLSAKPYLGAELFSVKTAILDTLSLLEWEAKDHEIAIISKLKGDDDDFTIAGSDSDLRVVTLNLAQNAFHAMPDGGELVVAIESIDNIIKIVFSDTGIGISPEHMKDIFHPFYSKRADASKGTGLGLAICKSIIKSHRGKLEVNSKLGYGSDFIIFLPKNAG